MRRNYGWKEHAKETVNRISEIELKSPLGLHCEPDEYLDILQDYTKLLFDMNEIPENFIGDLDHLNKDWNTFKCKLRMFCKNLYEELEKETQEEE